MIFKRFRRGISSIIRNNFVTIIEKERVSHRKQSFLEDIWHQIEIRSEMKNGIDGWKSLKFE